MLWGPLWGYRFSLIYLSPVIISGGAEVPDHAVRRGEKEEGGGKARGSEGERRRRRKGGRDYSE